MKTRMILVAAVVLILATGQSMAMQEHSSQGTDGHGMSSQHKSDHGGDDKQMDHSGMGGTYKHMASDGGVDAEFQVMSLASMNMTSDQGDTHHIMVNLKAADAGEPIKNAMGKIKVIAPDKSEQVSPLKNYSGVLAANFSFKEPGKYGVICLVKNGDTKHVYKFWYDHMQ